MSSSRVFVVALLGCCLFSAAVVSSRITIDVGDDNVTSDLQTYLDDLHVAVAAVQYTANTSAKMLTDLMNKLQRDEVKCQCDDDEIKPRSTISVASKMNIGRLDYRRTSPVAAHKLHTRPLKWNDARKSCKREDAELATIEGIDEAQLLAKVLDEARRWSDEVNATESAFMGVHSHFEANDWLTVRGDAVPASWSVAVTNDSLSAHRCAVLTVHSNLEAADCERPRPYLCELRLLP